MQPMRRDAEEGRAPGSHRAELFQLIRQRSFGRGKITLVSGRESDFYFDMKPTMLHPAGAAWVADLILDELATLDIDYIGGLEMGAVPLAAAVATRSHERGHPVSAFFVRKKVKEHGAQKLIEGLTKSESLAGKRIVILEDVTTTGGSAIQAATAATAEGANVVLVLSIVDRQEGAAETFAAARLPFRSLFTAEEFLRD